jgi:putative acetyltransferase
MLRIRAREPDDAEAITEILNCPSVYAGTLQLPLRSLAERRARMDQPAADVHHLVAELDGRVVGSLSVHVEANPRRRHCGGIGMAVHEDFQGQGVGTALLAAALDLADNWLGLRRLELTVYTDNAPAVHLYEKLGFVIEGTARQFALRHGQYVDALSMARLRPPGDGA